ncbi:hypothetical protein GMST_35020 [Geomonas silvestris]|uniref:Uncharacterized protein n=1 Tax=Geomonas silvestris TaxID=2740184 RepID=A0A6V8MMT1_9BACT|nr:hypothetical protein [Geomonas silvestris]GFO61177.1 hypothetical protein GMST_35020 [Geomonas silvestris]
MLTSVEVVVMQNLGVTLERMEDARTGGVKVARNAEGQDSFTEVQRQVCEILGLTELEFMQAMSSEAQSDPVAAAMIETLLPHQKGVCKDLGITEKVFMEALPLPSGRL